MDRCGFWIDAYKGEPVTETELFSDLETVDVVYLGERHTLDRHHAIQHAVLQRLIACGRPVILGLEQFEAFQQPILDRYNRREITFEALVKETDWPSSWSNYEDYRPLVETVHDAGGIIVGLNARQTIVRKVARGGLASLSADERGELPADIDTGNTQYRQYLSHLMKIMVHVSSDSDMLDRMFTAQVCRDEMMAESLARAIDDAAAADPVAVVICGSGHVSHRCGIPDRLQSRLPRIRDRVLVLSGSGDVSLSPGSRKMSREIVITHEHVKCFDVPVADYLHVVRLNEATSQE